MNSAPTLTTTQILGGATELLVAGGYVPAPVPSDWPGAVRLFEDAYGIVALHAYETWDHLISAWDVAQGQLVDLISEHLTRTAPKAWEGYLALFSAGPTPARELAKLVALRYDTNRVRKLVVTGDELQTLDDLRTALLPLMPLDIHTTREAENGVLDELPQIISDQVLTRELLEAVVDAYHKNQSIIERMHDLRVSGQ